MGRHTASVVFIEPLLGELKRGIFEDAEWDVVLHRFQGNGELSIDRIADDDPDLIVLDYFFGQEKSARDLIARFRGNHILRDVPILVCRYPDIVISRPYSIEDFMLKATELVERNANQK
jgi:CheY-like chemotaxis protein